MASAFDGVTIEEAQTALGSSSYKAVQNRMSRMFIDKQLFRAVRFRSTRYFSTQAAAEAYEARHPLTNEQKRKRKGAQKVLAQRHWALTLPGTPRPMHVPKAEAVVVVPEGLEVTKCPNWTHDPRYTVGPNDRVPSLFSALPLGVYLEA